MSDYGFVHKPNPYRIIACGSRVLLIGKGKRQRTKITGFGIVAWNGDDQARELYDPGRLAGAGTFCWPGLHATRREAMRLLTSGEYQQVQVRTNQDRTLYIWNVHSTGITGYSPKE